MNSIYFKKRKNFDFKPHKYDLGIPFWQKNSHLDMHFLNKVVELKDGEYENLYDYHKNYYLTSSSEGKKEVFFEELFILLDNQIKKELLKDPLKMDSKSKTKWEKRIQKYKSFLAFLKDKEEWDIIKSKEEVAWNQIQEINEKLKAKEDENKILQVENNNLFEQLNRKTKKIEELELERSKSRVLPQHKICIRFDKKETLIDIFHQLILLEHWNHKKYNDSIFLTQSYNTWAKMISNNFTEGNQDISFDTVKKHFEKTKIGLNIENRHYKIKVIN
jgi:hypothetical protein